jgi:hypothetical protein
MDHISVQEAVRMSPEWIQALPFLEKAIEHRIIRVNDEGELNAGDVNFVIDWLMGFDDFTRSLFIRFFDYEDVSSQSIWYATLKRLRDKDLLKQKLAKKIVNIKTMQEENNEIKKRFFSRKKTTLEKTSDTLCKNCKDFVPKWTV